MGLLKVKGTIDLSQFWPNGESDADTTKVIVQTDQKAFTFRAHPGIPSKVTHVFENATVMGKVKKPPIDKKGRITVRLQGIDAPELHYRPSPVGNKSLTEVQQDRFKQLNKQYRQHFGETATVKLHELLKQVASAQIPCTVTTMVDKPNDVFDTYGRFVGDILVKINSKQIDINQWLVEEGWAFPTFYASMSTEEISTFLTAAKKGQKKTNRLWKYLQSVMGKFDFKLVYRKKGSTPNPNADIGSLIMPKLYRRQCTWAIYNSAGIFAGDFLSYLTKNPDSLFLTKEFLEQGVYASKHHLLNQYLSSNGTFKLQPQDMVFMEKPSRLVGPNGKTVTQW